MKKCFLSITLVVLLLVLLTGIAFAQAYTFNIPEETVNVYWNEDGSVSLDYVIVFNNDPQAHSIDYVDLGLPHPSFVDSSITADVNGARVTDISRSGFQGTGPGVVSGVAVGLGSQTISSGGKGTVHVSVGKINNMLYPDNQNGYASADFAPAWFTTAHGATNLTVVFHFPKSIAEKDASWHNSPAGWADQPEVGVDDQGRLSYTWNNPSAVMNQEIDFGASFPSTLVFPTASLPTAIPLPASTSNQSDNSGTLITIIIIVGLAFVGLIGYITRSGGSVYELPKVSVEGYGIKRGLTAIEAAVVLGEPVDKILTMMLFSVVKKGAAQVITNDPLDIKVVDPPPEGLLPYEIQFLNAFKKYSNEQLRDAIEFVMVTLFRDVNRSMDGFNREQTIDYYKKIVQDAWAQVETAGTPEVTSQKFEENLDWAMLDHEYDTRTQRVFENKPVFLPVWWSLFDPTVHHPSAASSLTPPFSTPEVPGAGGTPAGKITLPVLPGADFAASMVRSTQNFSGKIIGDINSFTQNVKTKAAPPPPPPHPTPAPHPTPSTHPTSTSSFWGSSGSHPIHRAPPVHHGGGGGGGGHHCACAGGGR